MTEVFNEGDPVTVHLDAVVHRHNTAGAYTLRCYAASGELLYGIPPELLTHRAAPVKVGDVLTGDSPEPPFASVVINDEGQAAKRVSGGWAFASATLRTFPWCELFGPPVTLVYVPEVDS